MRHFQVGGWKEPLACELRGGGEVASVLGERRPSGPWMSSTVLLEAKHESTGERLWFHKACVLAV